jgi:hypothetical protein
MGKGWRYAELPNVFFGMENEKYGCYGQWALNIPEFFSYISCCLFLAAVFFLALRLRSGR